VAEDVARRFEARERGPENTSEEQFLRAVLSGYPDRVARRRQPGSPEVLLASGTGATVAPESGVRDGEFLVALDLSRPPARRPGPLDPANVARIRLASRIERDWLTPTASEVTHRFDKHSGIVKAAMLERYDELVLTERPMAVDPEIAANLLAEAWLARGPRDEDERLLRRLRFAAQSLDLDTLVRAAAYGARSLDHVELARALPPEALRAIDRDAPETLAVPSGRHHRLEYNDDGTVAASVKLQELFGLAETPRIGPRREPVVLSLLAPNGRPVQVTRDLRSFWNRTYPEVRKELRGRYPKHPWPEDPWTAPPTARAKRRT
jgi:ATP-dependent helicase HrpB